MAPVPVKVKLLKEMYHVDLDVDEPVLKFRQAIEEVTYIPPAGQRLKMKGVMAVLPQDLETWDEYKDKIVPDLLFMIMQ